MAAMTADELKALHATYCQARFAKLARLRLAFDHNPEVPELLKSQYPKIESKLQSIGKKIEELQDKNYLQDSVKSEVLARVNLADARYSERDVTALRAVIERLHDVAAWTDYAKQLTIDGAAYIAAKGSALEKSTLLETGEISRRAMLAVLANRAAGRGETIAKISGDNQKSFFAQVRRGPFIDRGLDFNDSHGQLPHLLQKDFVAPTLEEIYGSGSREFYQKITETYDWNPIFDRDAYHFSSPTGIRIVLGKVLPLENVGTPR
jgi:hypothetical protein